MNPRSSLVAISLLALNGCLTSPPELNFRAGVFQPSISGDSALGSSGGGDGLDVDVDNDLALDDTDTTALGRVGMSAGGINAHLSGFHTSQSGTGTLTAAFGDISSGSTVNTDLDLVNIKGAITVDVLDTGLFRLAPGLAVEYFALRLDVQNPGGASERLNTGSPVPSLLLEAEFDPPTIPLFVTAEIGGSTGAYGDFKGALIDAQALVFCDMFETFELFAGYRTLLVEFQGKSDGQRFDTDFQLGGFLAGGSLRF